MLLELGTATIIFLHIKNSIKDLSFPPTQNLIQFLHNLIDILEA